MDEIIIVGAGPVGLMLACELGLAGVRPMLLDKRPERSTLPKANGFGGQIVRVLALRGLLERFEEAASFAGRPPGFPFGGVPVSFAGLDVGLDLLAVQQPQIERILEERAAELGVQVEWGAEVASLDDLRARYVVGCDGASSTVRELAGFDFPGTTDEEVVRLGHFRSVRAKGIFGDAGDWRHTPRGQAIVTSLQPGVFIVGVREKGAQPAGPMTVEELRESLRRVLDTDVELGEPIWVSRTVAQARQATEYRRGDVFLAGDAAHLFPAGGSALNAGLMDAVNLGWKLAAAVHGTAPDGLLDTYHTERHPVGAAALRQTRAQAALGRHDGEEGEALRGLLSELFAYDGPRRHLAEVLQGSEVRYGSAAHPLVGRLVPELGVGAELLRAAKPFVVDFAGRVAGLSGIDVVRAEMPDPPAEALLIRPDGYVAWAGIDGLEEALASITRRAGRW
ncbi:FAD-dependent monooxygenase [Nonomuraea sp. NPDC050536]|uniref:FAD-dependent monooxygenase n=1 Tax=Nonomuraea sp. NPDC050536 TaxID=3364366 RepID=UPI0037C96E26